MNFKKDNFRFHHISKDEMFGSLVFMENLMKRPNMFLKVYIPPENQIVII